MYWFIIGLLLALGGVGTVEQSTTTLVLVQGCLVAIAGLALCMVGVDVIKEEHRRKTKNNPTLW